jgi:hypothetical protein
MRKVSEERDTVGDSGIHKLYTAYDEMTIGEFRNHCSELVKNSRSSKSKKLTFIRQLHTMNTKDKMVKFMTNFILSGEGMSV